MKAIAILLLFFSIIGCSDNPDSYRDYYQDIIRLRANKNYHFLNPQQSPIDSLKLKTFKGLAYFEPDITYRVNAQFKSTGTQTFFALPHTQNKTYNYSPAGIITFSLEGKQLQLTAYVQQYNNGDSLNLFIPFTDATNGKQTYSGGRYLDITISSQQQELTLDFNLVYNPYCVYNKSYSCPIAPKENNLPIAINAGEKIFVSSE